MGYVNNYIFIRKKIKYKKNIYLYKGKKHLKVHTHIPPTDKRKDTLHERY